MSKRLIPIEYPKGDSTEVKFYEMTVKGLLDAIKDLKVHKAKQSKLIEDMTKEQIAEMQEHQKAMEVAAKTIKRLEELNKEIINDLKYYCEHCKQLEKAFAETDAYRLRCELAGADETIFALRKRIAELEKQNKEGL